MKRLWALLLWLPLAAQVVPDLYIVELSGEPAAVYAAQEGRRPAESQRGRVQAQQASLRRALEQAGAEVVDSVDTVANALVVRLADSEAWRLSAMPGVRRVHPVRQLRMLLDHALPLHTVPEAWAQVGGAERAGVGVKIAILDTGIDHKHPGFQDPSLEIPPGFPKVNQESDKEFTSNKVIVARNYSAESTLEDRDGHGTGLAMAAAGVPNQGTQAFITGVAPKAFLGNYKISGADGSSSDARILKAMDDAAKDGMDVVSLSFGSVLAYRPSDDILARAIETAAAAGVLTVVAAGNDGPDPNTISSPATAPSAIAVGASSNDRAFTTTVVVEGASPYLGIPGSGPNSTEPLQAPLGDVSRLDGTGRACGSLPEGSLAGRVALILRGPCTFEEKLNNAQNAGAVGAVVYTDAARPEADVIMNVGAATLPAMLVSYADGVDIKRRLEENPDLSATLHFQPAPYPIDPNRVVSFSSRGPNTDQGIKPDLLAVGTWIHTATQKANPDPETLYDPSGYVTVSGTSFSAPLVAGAAAVLKAARPGLEARQYRSLLVNSARALLIGAAEQTAPVQQAGAGTLDLAAAIQSTVAAFPASVSFGVGGSTVDAARDVALFNLGAAADTVSLAVLPAGPGPAPVVSTAILEIAGGGRQTVSVRLTGSGLEPGQYAGFVQVQASRAVQPIRIPYWYAVPSQTPRYLTLLRSRSSGVAGALLQVAIIFRVTEASGVALLNVGPAVTTESGGGLVKDVYSIDALVPGAYAVDVSLGPTAGSNKFRLRVGDLWQDVTIQGTTP
jgi:minor extracellular serine protease Vpr